MEEKHDADYILITHDHYDHFSPEDIRKVEVADDVGRIETVNPGDQWTGV